MLSLANDHQQARTHIARLAKIIANQQLSAEPSRARPVRQRFGKTRAGAKLKKKASPRRASRRACGGAGTGPPGPRRVCGRAARTKARQASASPVRNNKRAAGPSRKSATGRLQFDCGARIQLEAPMFALAIWLAQFSLAAGCPAAAGARACTQRMRLAAGGRLIVRPAALKPQPAEIKWRRMEPGIQFIRALQWETRAT